MSARRRDTRHVPRLITWAAALLTAGAAASPGFDSLPGAKALAELPDEPAVTGIAHSEPHDLAAARTAVQRCEAAGRERGHSQARCEIVRLNDLAVTRGRDIRGQVPERPHPLYLWRYRHAGTTVYLAGSIHILKPSLYPLPAQLVAAFDAADHLVLEVHVDGPAAGELQRRTLDHALLADGRTLADVLPEALYQRVSTRLAAYGISAAMVSRAKPALVTNQLVLSRLSALGYDPDAGVERYFLARRRHQQIHELETVDAQLALLFDQPLATQVALLEETLDQEADIEAELSAMLVAWLSGDDVRLLELFETQAGTSPEAQAFTRALLDERNPHMAEGIRRLLHGGAAPATYFVLVGAAHLLGERGIVALLDSRGLAGERILSDDHI